MDLPKGLLLEMYRRMVAIRQFEEEAGRLMAENRIPGLVHLYVGQEAVAVGACAALRPDDYITSTHRGHGHLIAKGGDIRYMYAELFGRSAGYCKGKGGSMHIAALELGMLGANGIVGGGAPIAVGAAFAAKYKGTEQVCLCFFGDGASNQGAFHEAANMAALFRLPLIFVCENNLYGEYTPQERHQTIRDVAERAKAYAMPAAVVDGQDVLAVYQGVGAAVERARQGQGPSLVECKTYRYYDHVGIGLGVGERPKEEIALWRARDPIVLFGERLAAMGALTATEAERIQGEVQQQVAEAIRFAEESPLPGPDEVLADVYT